MVILGYTIPMKTAISVPDDVFTTVEEHVSALGMTRSQFYSVAARKYLDELENTGLVNAINEAVDLETASTREETAEFISAGITSSNSRLGDDQW